jgi:hypothetical protein
MTWTRTRPRCCKLNVGRRSVQILLLDLVFSIDSIITAVGMTDHLPIMVIAVIVAVRSCCWPPTRWPTSSTQQPDRRHAGAGLPADDRHGADRRRLRGFHVPKGYIYAAMAFSALVEGLNMLARRAQSKRPLRKRPR